MLKYAELSWTVLIGVELFGTVWDCVNLSWTVLVVLVLAKLVLIGLLVWLSWFIHGKTLTNSITHTNTSDIPPVSHGPQHYFDLHKQTTINTETYLM